MNDSTFINQSLYLQGLPTYETDIQHIQNILQTIEQSEKYLKKSPLI